MTRRTNARIAGAAFLLYIALGIASLTLWGRATGGEGIAARLASLAEHAAYARTGLVLSLFASFSALVLAVTLYGITRDEDHEIAMLGLAFRVGEGVVGGIGIQRSLGLLWLATTTGATAPDANAARDLAAFFMGQRWSGTIAAIFFAVGSTIFCWLLLRGRMIPVGLAWLGVLASVLLVVLLPLELGGLSGAMVGWWMWMPMLVFELGLALWFIVKGVAAPSRA